MPQMFAASNGLLSIIEDLWSKPNNNRLNETYCDHSSPLQCSTKSALTINDDKFVNAEHIFIPSSAAVRDGAGAVEDYFLIDAWNSVVSLTAMIGTATSATYGTTSTQSPFQYEWQNPPATMLTLVATPMAGSPDRPRILDSCIDFASIGQFVDAINGYDAADAQSILESWAEIPFTSNSSWTTFSAFPRVPCLQVDAAHPLLFDLVTVMDAVGIGPNETNLGIGMSNLQDISVVGTTGSKAYLSTGICASLDIRLSADDHWLSASSLSSVTSKHPATGVFSQIPCELGLPTDNRVWRTQSSGQTVGTRGLNLQTTCIASTSHLDLWTHVLAVTAALISASVLSHLILESQADKDWCCYNAVRKWEKYLAKLSHAPTAIHRDKDPAPTLQPESKLEMRPWENVDVGVEIQVGDPNTPSSDEGLPHFRPSDTDTVDTLSIGEASVSTGDRRAETAGSLKSSSMLASTTRVNSTNDPDRMSNDDDDSQTLSVGLHSSGASAADTTSVEEHFKPSDATIERKHSELSFDTAGMSGHRPPQMADPSKIQGITELTVSTDGLANDTDSTGVYMPSESDTTADEHQQLQVRTGPRPPLGSSKTYSQQFKDKKKSKKSSKRSASKRQRKKSRRKSRPVAQGSLEDIPESWEEAMDVASDEGKDGADAVGPIEKQLVSNLVNEFLSQGAPSSSFSIEHITDEALEFVNHGLSQVFCVQTVLRTRVPSPLRAFQTCLCRIIPQRVQ